MKFPWNISAAITAALVLFSCADKGEEPEIMADAPKLISASPADGSKDIEGATLKLVLSFDQNIKCPDKTGISISGDASITSVVAYNADLSVSVSDLIGGRNYTLTIPQGAVQGFKQTQKAADRIELSFTTKYIEPTPDPEPDTDYELKPTGILTNANATEEAKRVFTFLTSNCGKTILTGVQSEGTANNNKHVDLIATKTGKHPALAGYDFIFTQYSPTPAGWSWVVNYNDMSDPIAHWKAGGIVNYMWHWNVPQSKEAWDNGVKNGNYDGYNFYGDKTTFDIKEALKEGTWQHDFIMKDMEEVAGYLKILQDAGVPVIWRPLHEAAGNYNLYGVQNNAWFWWGRGGASACKQLYRLMRDTFEKTYGLNNLIWVWTLDVNQQAKSEWASWYPGDEYVDIIGCDIYEDNTAAKRSHYQACVNLGKGKKLVTISECGNIPDPDKCLADGEKWSWFMVWSSTSYALNTDSYWKQIMASSKTTARESMPALK